MIRTSPFHERTSAANETGLWAHWSGYLSAAKYQMSEKFEYFAIRNSAGLFDSSPLYKYRIHGPDAERFLAGVLARDIRACPVGHGQYTIWCDERGYVVEDGVVLRHAPDEFMLTAAEPNLAYFADAGRPATEVEIEDVSEQFGVLAVQGPSSRTILAGLDPDVGKLGYFGLTKAKIGRRAGDRLADRLHGRPRLRDLDRRPRMPSPSGTPSSRRRQGSGVDPVRADGAVHGPDRGRPAAARRRLPVEPVRLDGRPPLDADRARPRLDVQDLANERPRVPRPRGDRPRDRRQDVALEADRPGPRLARLRPAVRRGRADPAQGPHADRGRVLHLRRRSQAARLRDEPHVLADAPAPHRPRPRAARR